MVPQTVDMGFYRTRTREPRLRFFSEGSVLTFRSRQGEDTLCLFGVGPEFRPCPPGTSSTDLEQVRAEFGRLHACVRRLCLE